MELERQDGGLVYNIVPLKTISPLASSSSSKCEKGKWFMEEINEVVSCVEDVEEMTRLLLEKLWSGIFRRQARVATKLGVTT